MEVSRFARHLEQASREAIQVAHQYVTNHLPDQVLYCLRTDVCDTGEMIGRLNQDGAIPIWIDIYADSADDRFTYIRLICSNETSEAYERLRYQSVGNPPFQVSSPVHPPGWKGVDQDGRFGINRSGFRSFPENQSRQEIPGA